MRAKGGNGTGSGATLWHYIYPAQPITTVSLAANTYCMVDGFSSRASRAVPLAPGSNLAALVNKAING